MYAKTHCVFFCRVYRAFWCLEETSPFFCRIQSFTSRGDKSVFSVVNRAFSRLVETSQFFCREQSLVSRGDKSVFSVAHRVLRLVKTSQFFFCREQSFVLQRIQRVLTEVDIVSAGQNQPRKSTRMQSISVKLPKLEIKKFSGNPSQWRSFWDSFQAAV